MLILNLPSCSVEESILFEQIGESDKPFSCVVITTNKNIKKECEMQVTCLVTRTEFIQIEKYLAANRTKAKDSINKYSFGSFQVQIGGRDFYKISGQHNSIIYFSNLIKYLDSIGNQDLAEVFETSILVRLTGVGETVSMNEGKIIN